MKAYYLYNSGFAVIVGRTLLVFDYYDEGEGGFEEGYVNPEDLANFEKVYFFVSHAHYDHFNRIIFKYKEYNPDTVYVLSDDIRHEGAVTLGVGQEYGDGTVYVRAHGSTDEGVSFEVRVDELTLFHAGDLNCWHWVIDNTEEDERLAREEFSDTLREIKQTVPSIDVAFFPVDPRMKGVFWDGAAEFIAVMHPRVFVPMHFRQNYGALTRFFESQKGNTRIIKLTRRGQSFEA